MAKKQATKDKKRVPHKRHTFLKVLCSLTILVACLVCFIGGVQEGARTSKVIYHCMLSAAVIGTVFWAAIRAMTSYEEINGGQA